MCFGSFCSVFLCLAISKRRCVHANEWFDTEGFQSCLLREVAPCCNQQRAYKGTERINVNELQKLVLNKYMLSTHPTLLHRHGCCEFLTLKHIKQGNWWNKTHMPHLFCSVNSLPLPAQLSWFNIVWVFSYVQKPPKTQHSLYYCNTHLNLLTRTHLIQPHHFHWPSQHDSLWPMIYVSALDVYYIVVRKHPQPDELDHSGHHSPYMKALYILLASKKEKKNKASINLTGPHLTALY